MKKLSMFALVSMLVLSLALSGCTKQEEPQNDSVTVTESEESEELVVGLQGVPRDPSEKMSAAGEEPSQKAMSGSAGAETPETQEESEEEAPETITEEEKAEIVTPEAKEKPPIDSKGRTSNFNDEPTVKAPEESEEK